MYVMVLLHRYEYLRRVCFVKFRTGSSVGVYLSFKYALFIATDGGSEMQKLLES